jgi:hypothetical protein
MKYLSRALTILLPISLVTALPLAAKPPAVTTTNVLNLERIDSPIVIDGKLDDSVWQRLAPLELTQVTPSPGRHPSERTEILLAYDDTYLYAAARCYDSQALQIRANQLLRDQSQGDDLFAIVLDTFNDNENAVAFYTNPAGTRIDEAIANDAVWAGRPPFNRSWNTFWDSAATRTADGWFAEMRIPFASLRFQPEGERVVMGVIAWRHIARKKEIAAYPPIPPQANQGQVKPSLAADIELRGVTPKRALHLTPYLLAGRTRNVDIDDSDSKTAIGYSIDDQQVSEVGLDLKYSLSSNLTLDMTLNTDFAQVEADDAQVNLSRYSLFQPEKRLFFQERSSIFDFGTGGRSRLFYSRRIGIDEDSNPVRILGGARVVGRIGGWDIGALDMQTDASEVTASENLGAFRVRRQVYNGSSYLGGMVTSRIGGDGSSNIAYGLDSTLRFDTGDELVMRWAQTFDQDAGGTVAKGIDSGRFHGSLMRRTRQGWGYSTAVGWSGPDYAPELGFANREDYRRLFQEVRYSRLGDDQSWYRQRAYWLEGGGYWRNQDGSLETGNANIGGNIQTRSGAWIWVALRGSQEDIDELFELTDGVEVPVGQYSSWGVSGGFNMPQNRTLSLRGNIYMGGFYDGTRTQVTIEPTWTISQRVSMGGYYQLNAIKFDQRQQAVDIHLARLRLRYSLTGKLFADLFSQYSSLDQEISGNLRFRYAFREGTDLYVVLNGASRTTELVDGLVVPRTTGRSLLVKYSHTFTL